MKHLVEQYVVATGRNNINLSPEQVRLLTDFTDQLKCWGYNIIDNDIKQDIISRKDAVDHFFNLSTSMKTPLREMPGFVQAVGMLKEFPAKKL